MKELFESATHCFWHFSAFFIISYLVSNVTLHAITRFYRMVTVMVKGWPPAHLDADGDHIETIKGVYKESK